MIECRAPKTKKEFQQYYQLRWQILRAPWQQAQGSEQDELEKQSIHRAIFDADNNILAIGRLHFTDQHHAQVRYMAVEEAVQGQGYGQRILAALEQEAQLRGAKSLSLQARESALNFYQGLGYQYVAKSHLLYQQIQHHQMEKALAPLPAHLNELSTELQQTWHNTIPLSKAMNIEISFYDKQRLITSCEPSFNKNLHNTMFAGSIYTLATLTGWGWVYLQLVNNECEGDIVLADASIKYLAPIAGVVSSSTCETQVQGDILALQSNQKARFNVAVELYSGDIVAAKFIGKYVVLPKND
ncbi:bifunctional GNAT family N-acetyltransferase/hotdog fold thioesterase [Thalassotalea sp. G2M2-11]|uniref:bifunctional GNAT family N-acetyltransferase/hotdog fold thioesterase n=1 Tax=Thalassotalea sp. G2M2-11 TaxID=2787627 RepID=UPI0019CF9E31|nr:bifunctional GNAT family N-acetyltransferase/hotdog fold thioesterase [Thalassotalea sp. G2M2-11]